MLKILQPLCGLFMIFCMLLFGGEGQREHSLREGNIVQLRVSEALSDSSVGLPVGI